MTYDVFISYSRKDTNIANQICAAFDRVGISYFIDRQGIGGGMEFPKVLAPAIKDSNVFLLLASKNAYQSPYTSREVTFAFNKKNGEKMLPYIIDDSVLPDDLELVFSNTNWRTIQEHPIDTVLIEDILHLLGRESPSNNRLLYKTISSYFSFRKIEKEDNLRQLIAEFTKFQKDVVFDQKDFNYLYNETEVVYSFLPIHSGTSAMKDVFNILAGCIDDGRNGYKKVFLYINIAEIDNNELTMDEFAEGTDLLISKLTEGDILWGHGIGGVRSEMLVIMSK